MKKSVQKKLDTLSPEQKLDYMIEKLHKLEKVAYPNMFVRLTRWISSHWILVLFMAGLTYTFFTYSTQIVETYTRIQKLSDQINSVEQTTREGIGSIKDTLDTVG